MDNRSGLFIADSNTFNITAAQLSTLLNRGMYINVHSALYPGGEIRGQILGMAQTVFRAHLAGSHEIPMVYSTGHGMVMAELNDTTLTLSGTFSDLTGSFNGGSHIHLGIAGRSGGVVRPVFVNAASDLKSGELRIADNTIPLTPAQVSSMMSRMYYLNIHTDIYTGGEIRGQMVPLAMAYFYAYTGGAQEAPPVNSWATGAFLAEMQGDMVTVSGSFDNLSSTYTASHIHTGAPGISGPVLQALNVILDADSMGGTYSYTTNKPTFGAADKTSLRNRMLYVNIHSDEYPRGEIRGQLMMEATMYFASLLSGESENPPANTTATGTIMSEVTGRKLVITGSFTGLSSAINTPGSAHLHRGMAGENGGVKIGLTPTINADTKSGSFDAATNTYNITDGFVDSLLGRMVYANVHTASFPGGEIRGQMLPLANMYYTARLSGINEVSPVVSNGMGAVKVEVNGTRMTVTGSFSGLESEFNGGAHLHLGATGINGGVVLPLKVNASTDMLSGHLMADSNVYQLSTLSEAHQE
nr:CHRD domain-containing protein [Bacteroidota bacterium]